MAAPAGYIELGRIGFVDKGTYAAATTYRIGDVIYYSGSTWVALKDNLKGVAPAEGANWKYMARGFAAALLSLITAIDNSAVLGTKGASVNAQSLIDAITDRVMTKLITKTQIVDNLLATDPNTVLSGPMGKQLKEYFDQLNSDITQLNGEMFSRAPIYISGPPAGQDTSYVFSVSTTFKIQQIDIPVYSKGIFVATSNDGVLIAVSEDTKTVIAFRSNGVWGKARIL